MPEQATSLYITLGPGGTLKIGTCAHCVIDEQGRPGPSWDPNGDLELDFDRDRLLSELRSRGLTVEVVDEYVCP